MSARPPAGTASAASVGVCQSTSCLARGSGDLLPALADRIRVAGQEDAVVVRRVGCLGLCSAGPLVRLAPEGVVVRDVRPDDPDRIDAVVAAAGRTVPGNDPGALGLPVVPEEFLAPQQRVVTENFGRIDPESLEDYRAAGGYDALRTVLHERSPAEVVAEVSLSGLRGRGGAGYPTGLKWATVAKSRGGRRWVVCNADEGDPGAYMDRTIMESDPHRVIEGMVIGGYAVGARSGYIYCRAEYPLPVARLRGAIEAARGAGLLGTGVAGTDVDFDIEVRIGAGAYVCGEETALMASIRGGRGTPRPRPPYPAASGLFGEPTLINNVETFAAIPSILRDGGDTYAAVGTGRSRGTKVFALAGAVVRTGLVEVPLGVSLRHVVEDVGGGMAQGRRFKAVQTGGPSGGCIPSALLDLPVDYEAFSEVGTIIGSGGMIVLDDRSCMVDLAAYFMDFCRDESCGACAPCRVGTTQLVTLLERLRHGTAVPADLDQVVRLSRTVATTSLCGLGQNAPNPVFSTMRHFPEEYRAHVVERRCPAGVCPMDGGAGGPGGGTDAAAAERAVDGVAATRLPELTEVHR